MALALWHKAKHIQQAEGMQQRAPRAESYIFRRPLLSSSTLSNYSGLTLVSWACSCGSA